MFMMEHPERITSLTANPKNTNQFITCYDGTESLYMNSNQDSTFMLLVHRYCQLVVDR